MQYLFYATAFVLAEVENRLFLVIEHYAAGIIQVAVSGREFRQEAYLVLKIIGISVLLGFKDFHGCNGIAFGTVSIIQILIAVELVSCFQRSLLELMENILYVN